MPGLLRKPLEQRRTQVCREDIARPALSACGDGPFADGVHAGILRGCCERHRQQELPFRIVAPERRVADLARERAPPDQATFRIVHSIRSFVLRSHPPSEPLRFILVLRTQAALIWLKTAELFQDRIDSMPRSDCAALMARKSEISAYLMRWTIREDRRSASARLT